MLEQILNILSQKKYILISTGSSLLLLLTYIYLGSQSYLNSLLPFTKTLSQKTQLHISTISYFFSNQNFLSSTLLVITILLFAVNLSLLIYYLNQKPKSLRSSDSLTLLGSIFGFLGAGCASCGPLILVAILGSTAGLISYLPLHGTELSLIGIILILYSTKIIIKRINNSNSCPLITKDHL